MSTPKIKSCKAIRRILKLFFGPPILIAFYTRTHKACESRMSLYWLLRLFLLLLFSTFNYAIILFLAKNRTLNQLCSLFEYLFSISKKLLFRFDFSFFSEYLVILYHNLYNKGYCILFLIIVWC